ncbi:hypothetical protein E4V42_22625 [Clostridium estertheticum]|uniref:DUF5668 domain-containing protein n=1 Tax=Clostridium estertheticum TaxID=238834 RepID=A0A5N7IV52_9CLOT|nr:hypothetical protein [Clostridium estertheticum]MPQ34184.1 hypothetical protein [Clostridium estertheticum]MPQ64607.1 hypothetical protein [Clostridium estertheticum]
MKKIPNIIFIILGIISIVLFNVLKIDGILAFLLIWVGMVFIGIGLFKGNNPFKVIGQFFSNFC